MSRWIMLLVLMASSASLAVAAGSGFPGILLQEDPGCIRIAPGGTELRWRIVYVTGDPAADLPGRLIFGSSCSDLVQCDLSQPTVFFSETDSDGVIVFDLAIGGCCETPAAVSLELDPGAVTVAVYDSVGSPDVSGDGEVTLLDFVLFQARFLEDGLTCQDLSDCDEFVNLSDFVVFMSEFLQNCP